MKKKILDIIAVSSIISGVFITIFDNILHIRYKYITMPSIQDTITINKI